jgi:hypothetical protein
MVKLVNNLLSNVTANLLTPGRRDLLEKLIITQLAKNFPEIYGTRRYTRAHHRFLS